MRMICEGLVRCLVGLEWFGLIGITYLASFAVKKCKVPVCNAPGGDWVLRSALYIGPCSWNQSPCRLHILAPSLLSYLKWLVIAREAGRGDGRGDGRSAPAVSDSAYTTKSKMRRDVLVCRPDQNGKSFERLKTLTTC